MACCSPWSHTVKHNLASEQETPLFLVQSSRFPKSNCFALHWQQCARVCADDGGRSKTLEAGSTDMAGWASTQAMPAKGDRHLLAPTAPPGSRPSPGPGPAPAPGTEALGHGGCFFLSGDSTGRKCLHHSPGQHQAAHRLNLTNLRSRGSASPIKTQGTVSWLRLADLATPSTHGLSSRRPPICLPPARLLPSVSSGNAGGSEASPPTPAFSSAPLLKYHLWSNGSLMLAPIIGLTLAFQTQIDRWLSTQPLGRLTRHPK